MTDPPLPPLPGFAQTGPSHRMHWHGQGDGGAMTRADLDRVREIATDGAATAVILIRCPCHKKATTVWYVGGGMLSLRCAESGLEIAAVEVKP